MPNPSPELHHLAVSLLKQGYVDTKHPLWEKKGPYLADLRVIFLVFGQELIEDAHGTFICIRQLTEFPQAPATVDSANPDAAPVEVEPAPAIPVIPLGQRREVSAPRLAVLLACRAVYGEHQQGGKTGECQTTMGEVVNRAKQLWIYTAQPGQTESKLITALENLQQPWLVVQRKGGKDELQEHRSVTIHQLIAIAIGTAELEHITNYLQSRLAANETDAS